MNFKKMTLIYTALVVMPLFAKVNTDLTGTYICDHKKSDEYIVGVDLIHKNISYYEITISTYVSRLGWPPISEFAATYILRGNYIESFPNYNQEVVIVRNGVTVKNLFLETAKELPMVDPLVGPYRGPYMDEIDGTLEIRFFPVALKWIKNSPIISSIHIYTKQAVLLKNCRLYGDIQL